MSASRKVRIGLALISRHSADDATMPSLLDVVAANINIMQVRISRSRMAGEPPDLIVTPHLSHLRLLDFHRAEEAIEEGRRSVQRVAHNLAEIHQEDAVRAMVSQ
jgi:NTE family protein